MSLTEPKTAAVSPESPWLGLRPFTEGVREYFFGRDAEVRDLFQRVVHKPLTVLFGRSGLGKTSLLQAALVPRLRDAGFLPIALRLDHSEGAAPLLRQFVDTLIAALTPVLSGFDASLTRLPTDARLPWLLFHDPVFGLTAPEAPRPVVLLDQFEEIFTMGQATSERQAAAAEFLEMLADVVENRVPESLRSLLETDDALADRLDYAARPAKILLSLREDFLHLLERYRGRMPALMDSRFELRLLTGPQALEAVIEPGRLRCRPGMDLAPLVSDATGGAIVRFVAGVKPDIPLAEIDAVPPLLSLLCAELNEQRLAAGESVIRPGQLEGRAEDILGQFYERCFSSQPSAVRTFVEDRLLSAAGFRESTTLDTAMDELVRKGGLTAVGAAEAIARLVNARLLTSEERGGIRRIELTHDILTSVARRSRDARVEHEAAARRRRERTRLIGLILGVALLIAGVSVPLAVWALLERAHAVSLLEEAARSASRADVSLARELKQDGEDAPALARLAQALRLDQRNYEAAALASAMLTQISWPLPLAGPMRHRGSVNSARFSPDGQRMVTASDDKTAQLWNPLNGEPIGEPMKHQGKVYSAEFSPDGKLVVTASEDGSAHVWDATTGKPVGQPMKHEDSVHSAQFSPDGRRVVTASHDHTAMLWDAATGKPIGEPMKHEKDVVSAQFSPDGQRVVTASHDDTARLWDSTTGKPIGQPMRHQGFVNAARFSEDGQWIVTASNDNTARLWDAHTGKPIGEPIKHEDSVYFAELSPDGQRVLTASQDHTARLWDAITGKPIGQPMGHEKDVVSAQFSPQGERVLTASYDNTARLWDAATGNPIGEPMKHEAEVVSAEFSPDGQWVLTASYDNTAKLWYAAIGYPTGEPMKHEKAVLCAELSPDGRRVVTASQDNTARLWDATTGYAIGEPMRHEGSVYSARFSPDGQRVVTGSADNTARLWDAATGRPIGEPMKHEGSVYFAQFSPDGQRVLTASQDNRARLWNALTGKPTGEPMEHEDWVYFAHFSPNGQRVVTASKDRTARLWDALTGKPIGQPMKHEGWVTAAHFSPDGQRVVTASKDGTARLWDALTGKPIGQPMEHEGWVYSAQFSPDSQRVVTASKDETARVWDAATGEPIGQPMQHEDWVYSAQFSPDGRRIVTASRDRTARIWNAATGEPIGQPMEHESWVYSASFSRNGQQILTASEDKTARLWDVPPTSSPENGRDLLSLADLAEATGDVAVQVSGQTEILNVLMPGQVRATREYLAAKFAGPSSALTPIEQLLKWSASEPRLRSLSPFSKRTVADWVEDRIKEGSPNGLRAAILVNPTNAQLAAHFGRALAAFALEKGIDPAEVRRARAEADYQTHRALKLAPDNDEVKKLRAEVVKLLQLPE